MNKSPLWIFIILGICLGVSQSFFSNTNCYTFIFHIIKRYLQKRILKILFLQAGFWNWFLYWFNALDYFSFLIYEKHFLLSLFQFFPLLMGLFFSLPSVLITILKNFIHFQRFHLFQKLCYIHLFL